MQRIEIRARLGQVALGSIAITGLVVLGACAGPAQDQPGRHVRSTSSHSQRVGPAGAQAAPLQKSAGDTTAASAPIVTLETSQVVLTSGAHLNFSGSGFAPGDVLNIGIAGAHGRLEYQLASAKADSAGNLPADSLVLPTDLAPGAHYLVVADNASQQVARAAFQVQRVPPTIQLDTYTAQPGYDFGVSGNGFASHEQVSIYLGAMTGAPIATLVTGAGGNLAGRISAPMRPMGEYTLYFIGRVSGTPATVGFNIQGFKPWVVLDGYAPLPGSVVLVSGRDFAPNERVLVYLNTTASQPTAGITADPRGTFTHADGFHIPGTLAGHQTLIFVGERSRAQTAASFDILPSSESRPTSPAGP